MSQSQQRGLRRVLAFFKAMQLDLFGGTSGAGSTALPKKDRDPVKAPGSRGGKFYRTDEGEVRYGERPTERAPKVGDLIHYNAGTSSVRVKIARPPFLAGENGHTFHISNLREFRPGEWIQSGDGKARPQPAPTPQPATKPPSKTDDDAARFVVVDRLMRDLPKQWGIKVEMVQGDRGPYLRFSGKTFDNREKFQALKADGAVWGFSDYSTGRKRFYWACKPEAAEALLRQFKGDGDGDSGRGGGIGRDRDRRSQRGDAGSGSGSRDGERGSIPGGQADVHGGATDVDRGTETGGTAEDAGARRKRRDRGNDPNEIAKLMEVGSPESRNLLNPELESILLGEQKNDVRLMADAAERGDRGFLLGNSTGTGKTFVGLGAIKQFGVPPTLIVVPNQGIAEQWRQEALRFGIDVEKYEGEKSDGKGVYITTYAGVRKHGTGIHDWGVLLLDEAHREAMKVRTKKTTALQIRELADSSKFTIYSTATPFERPQDCEYLDKLGLWGDEPFDEWAKAHGVAWQGKGDTASNPRFQGTKDGKVVDMLRIRADIIGQGKGVFREIQLDVPLSAPFKSLPVAGEHGDVVRRALDALHNVLDDRGLEKAMRVNNAKRLLDYVKLEDAANEAVAAVHRGERAAVFVSNVSPFDFDGPIECFKMRQEWEAERSAMGSGGAGEPPCGRLTALVGAAFQMAGLEGTKLPSPTDELRRKIAAKLGDDAVAVYTGQETDKARSQAKKDFQAGKKQVVIATIAAGGTGLSLHDTVGDSPRHQINIGLPWSGKEFQQLIGRTYRLGTKTPVRQTFFLTSDKDEQAIAGVVAGKLESMRAGVSGITADRNVAKIAEFTMSGGFEADGDDGDDGDDVYAKARLGLGWGAFDAIPEQPRVYPLPVIAKARPLFARRAKIEQELWYAEHEDLPEAVGAMVPALRERVATLKSQLADVDASLARLRR